MPGTIFDNRYNQLGRHIETFFRHFVLFNQKRTPEAQKQKSESCELILSQLASLQIGFVNIHYSFILSDFAQD